MRGDDKHDLPAASLHVRARAWAWAGGWEMHKNRMNAASIVGRQLLKRARPVFAPLRLHVSSAPQPSRVVRMHAASPPEQVTGTGTPFMAATARRCHSQPSFALPPGHHSLSAVAPQPRQQLGTRARHPTTHSATLAAAPCRRRSGPVRFLQRATARPQHRESTTSSFIAQPRLARKARAHCARRHDVTGAASAVF